MSEGYHDIDGKPIELHKLIIKEPAWAKNIILTLRADLERVKKEKMTLELLHGKAQKQVVKINTDLDRVTRERDALKEAAEEAIKWMNNHGERHHTPCGCTYCRIKAALAAVKPETCVWTWIDSPYPGGWKTSCKHQHSDYDGRCKKPVGICPYCHKPIEQKEV